MQNSRSVRSLIMLLILAVASLLQSVHAQQAPLPQYDDKLHLGVVNCSGNTCHGATQPFSDSNVLQNEFVTWRRQDSHANAYNVLLNDESKRIARNLGLNAAHEADLCLDCHANNVPPERRGERFQITEGVSCEACHGGSGDWIGPHYSTGGGVQNTHQENLADGLYPSEEPAARARLCLSCHFGTKDKFVTHRIMGAGHPRMSFELDTFTAIQPAHYQIDADYRERKGFWSGVKTWAIGQAVAVQTQMEGIVDSNLFQDAGVFPELVFFDCYACHHSLNDVRWGPRSSARLGPGVVRLGDSNLLMLQLILKRVDSGLAGQLQQATLALHAATTRSTAATRDAAQGVLSIARQAESRLAAHEFDAGDMIALLDHLVQFGQSSDNRDYAAAEQDVMAIGAIINSLDQQGLLSESQKSSLGTALDKLYAATESDDNYRPQQLSNAVKPLPSLYK